jgi:hypothetical protein
MEVSGHLHIHPEESALDIHWRGGWVGPRADLDVIKKRIPYRE